MKVRRNHTRKWIIAFVMTLLVTVLGGVLTKMIWSVFTNPHHKKEITYNFWASRRVYPYNRNIIDFTIRLINTGDVPIDRIPIRIYFRDRDAKILEYRPFVATFRYSEYKKAREYPAPIWEKPSKVPYLKEIARSLNKKIEEILVAFPNAWNEYPIEELKMFCGELEANKLFTSEFFKNMIKRSEKASSILTYDALPPGAYQIQTYIEPMSPKDEGEIFLQVIVKDRSLYRTKPPFLRVELSGKSNDITLGKFKPNLILDYAHNHIKIFILVLILSVFMNIGFLTIMIRKRYFKE